MKLVVFYNPEGLTEPEGWYQVGAIPCASENEARELAAKMQDGHERFVIED